MSQRLAPVEELVNAFEFEEAAKLTLPAATFSTIAGSERAAIDRLTFRPRMNVPTLDLDLSLELFGEKHFAPILVGPVSNQRRYHADGELATVRGAAAANAAVILSSHSSAPIADIVAQTKRPLWFGVYAEDLATSERAIQTAIAAGCQALCLTIGGARDGSRSATAARVNWTAVDRMRNTAGVPMVIKGMTDEAGVRMALEHGAQGLVVSGHGTASPAWVDTLPSIADHVRGRAVLLIDGSFRRGADILKALILGAHAVLLARPVMWALASYGADGVRAILEMLQSDLARQFGAIGAPNASQLTRDMVRIHKR